MQVNPRPVRSAPAPGAPLVNDDFAGALDTYTQLGPDTPVLSSGVLKNGAANTTALMVPRNLKLRDFHAVVKFTSGGSAGATTAIGIAFGLNDASNYMLAQYELSGRNLALYKDVAGSFSPLSSATGIEGAVGSGTSRWITLTNMVGRVVLAAWSTDPVGVVATPISSIDFPTATANAQEKGLMLVEPRSIALRFDTPNSTWSLDDFKVYA